LVDRVHQVYAGCDMRGKRWLSGPVWVARSRRPGAVRISGRWDS
jgi:hypothetical protein